MTQDNPGMLIYLCNVRGRRQILSKMDGLVNLQNVLVVGMTNRKELLDEALLRPGRMEVSGKPRATSIIVGY